MMREREDGFQEITYLLRGFNSDPMRREEELLHFVKKKLLAHTHIYQCRYERSSSMVKFYLLSRYNLSANLLKALMQIPERFQSPTKHFQPKLLVGRFCMLPVENVLVDWQVQ